jgi:alkyl hydroperoxide reductase subunit AhpC
LLSDAPNLKTMEAYGVLNPERRVARRSYFIIDKQGVVRYKRVLKPGEELIPNEELLEHVSKLNKS